MEVSFRQVLDGDHQGGSRDKPQQAPEGVFQADAGGNSRQALDKAHQRGNKEVLEKLKSIFKIHSLHCK